MRDITLIGIDIAKHVFHLHAVNKRGECVFQKKISRNKLLATLSTIPHCRVAMEACGSSNYWGRKLTELGFEVKLIPAQYVKPYVKSNKNDSEDAAAIAEACTRPHMRFVPVKSVEQQDIQSIHRIRQRIVRARVALTNEVRGLLAEYGIIVPQGIAHIRRTLAKIIDSTQLSFEFKGCLRELGDELAELSARIERFDAKIKRIAKSYPVCVRLQKIGGIGAITATALVAAIGDGTQFKNGRQCAAWLGLVPRQYSTGGKPRLGRISKRGNTELRSLLVQGAKNVVRYANGKTDRRSIWVQSLKGRKGSNKTAVAIANKNARIVWAIITKDEDFNRNYLPEFAQAA